MSSEQHMRSYYKKYIFFQKSKIGHGDATQNWIMRRTTVTEFSKTFLVFYKWLNLIDVQVIVHSKVYLVIFVCCEHAPWYFLSLLVSQVNNILNLVIFLVFAGPAQVENQSRGDSQTKDRKKPKTRRKLWALETVQERFPWSMRRLR